VGYNRSSGVALAMRHRQQWFTHIWLNNFCQGDEHLLYLIPLPTGCKGVPRGPHVGLRATQDKMPVACGYIGCTGEMFAVFLQFRIYIIWLCFVTCLLLMLLYTSRNSSVRHSIPR